MTSNSALERSAGSRALAAAAHRNVRWTPILVESRKPFAGSMARAPMTETKELRALTART